MILRLTFATLLFAALGTFATCTPSEPGQELAAKGRPFAQLAATLSPGTEVSVIHENWTATFRKTGPLPTDWILTSGPGQEILDHHAKGGFIEHVMSTIQTLQVNGPAPRGNAESFGLTPPLFAIKWHAPNGAQNEVRIAHQMSGSSAGFATLQIAGQTSPIVAVEGALYRMIDTISSFDSLRQQQILAPWTADDFDEIEIVQKTPKARNFYAQRAGDSWTDAKEKPIPEKKVQEVNSILEHLIHTQALSFVDDLTQTRKLAPRLQTAPEFSVILKDRKGRPVTFRLGWGQVEAGKDELLASSTHRMCDGDRLPCLFVAHRRSLMALQDSLDILVGRASLATTHLK